MRHGRSRRRPGSGSRARPRTGRPAGSAHTTRMPARSPRPAWQPGRIPAQVVDNDDGIVLDRTVEQSNPPDAPQLAPAVAQVTRRAGQAPGTVTVDRGYGEAKVDQQLTDLGVKNLAIPRKGKPSQAWRAEEHRKGLPPHCENGEPAAKVGSVISNAATAGTVATSTASKAPGLDRTRHARPSPAQDQRPGRITGDQRSITGPRNRQRHQHPNQRADFFRSK
jgi:hypothetical protein